MDMTKEYRAELRKLRAERNKLKRESRAIAAQTDREIKKIATQANHEIKRLGIARAKLNRSVVRRDEALARRQSILEGRLAK